MLTNDDKYTTIHGCDDQNLNFTFRTLPSNSDWYYASDTHKIPWISHEMMSANDFQCISCSMFNYRINEKIFPITILSHGHMVSVLWQFQAIIPKLLFSVYSKTISFLMMWKYLTIYSWVLIFLQPINFQRLQFSRIVFAQFLNHFVDVSDFSNFFGVWCHKVDSMFVCLYYEARMLDFRSEGKSPFFLDHLTCTTWRFCIHTMYIVKPYS